MVCEIKCKEYPEARITYDAIPEAGRDCSTTKYLLYKLAIQEGDSKTGKEPKAWRVGILRLTQTAAQCLDNICNDSMKDQSLLLACVIDAQETGRKEQVIHALRKVLDKYDGRNTRTVHLPALLR